MPSSFHDLSEEFNKAAQELANSDRPAETTLTQYFVLLNHKAETDEEKSAVVAALFDGGLGMLRRYVSRNEKNIWPSTVASIEKVFDALKKPESLQYLPQRAEQELADVAFALATRAHALDSDMFPTYSSFDSCRNGTIALANIALQSAGAAKTALAERTIDIKTSKPITPSKRLVLKQPDSGTP